MLRTFTVMVSLAMLTKDSTIIGQRSQKPQSGPGLSSRSRLMSAVCAPNRRRDSQPASWLFSYAPCSDFSHSHPSIHALKNDLDHVTDPLMVRLSP